jgi:hypothetical protein
MVYNKVHKMEADLRHKLFPPNAWMKVLHFNVLTSCPKDELHQWFIGLFGEHIIPAIVHRYTKVLQRPDLVNVDKDGNSHPLLSNEAVVRVFKRLADRLQGVQPGALQKPGRPGSVLLTRYDKHIPGIYLSYVPTQ